MEDLIPVRYNPCLPLEKEIVEFFFIQLRVNPNKDARHIIMDAKNQLFGSHSLPEPVLNELNDENSLFFRYLLYLFFCVKRKINRKELESEFFQTTLKGANGNLQLTPKDYESLKGMLHQNNGSRDNIKIIRRWIIERAHSIHAIGHALRDFVVYLPVTISNRFEKVITTLYVINDVFFNVKTASLIGLYTSLLTDPTIKVVNTEIDLPTALYSYLVNILENGYSLASNEAQKEKVLRLVHLWGSKNFYDSDTVVQLVEHLNNLPKWNPGIGESFYSPLPSIPLVSPVISESLIEKYESTFEYGGNGGIIRSNNKEEKSHETTRVSSHQTSISSATAQLPFVVPKFVLHVSRLPVGRLVDMQKASLAVGGAAYTPIEISKISASFGRGTQDERKMETLVSDFYRKLDDVLNSSPSATTKNSSFSERALSSPRSHRQTNISNFHNDHNPSKNSIRDRHNNYNAKSNNSTERKRSNSRSDDNYSRKQSKR
jgi:hypothetical protein